MIQSSPVTRGARYSSRRRALQRRGVPLVLAAACAFGAGAVVGAVHESAEKQAAERYTRAWARGDWATMRRLLSSEARARTSLEEFRAAHQRAAATATATALRPGRAAEPRDDVVTVPVQVSTRMFGTITTELHLPIVEEDGEARVAWREHLAFPGMRPGEKLTRRTRLPTRATLTAADGTVLARGEDRVPEDPELAASIRGEIGPIPEARAEELRAKGVPSDAKVGISGLERALDDELRGTPGGELLAGDRVLARSEPRRAPRVRSTIVPSIQRAAVQALAGRLGGVVALDPRTGEIQAAAGIGLSGLQPPGSVFKIITLAGALRAGITSTKESFPVETFTTIEGVRLENANGEACGGTLIETFAHSCNSVFAPLGAELGAERLVRAAEDFGFNAPPGIAGAATSTIPAAAEIGDDLAVGSSAIGQGRVQATALQMAITAATIAERGQRPVPTLLRGERLRSIRAIGARTAQTVARAMRAVVENGTGGAAAVPGGRVAGKTGTAELRSTVAPQAAPGQEPVAPAPANDPTDTTAWFAAFAPYDRPRVAVAVMLVGAGAGGQTAAPAARTVLEAALKRGR
jgi:cell division protein FtsI/penicillin-binding protein 2